MTERLAVLVVGGYGTFGGRLVRLLADEPRLSLLVGGRSAAKATRFCAALPAAARLVPVPFDRDGDVRGRLAALQPDMLVDASGPFQAYGEDRYRLVDACIAASVDYLDLADGAGFVAGIARFDAAARRCGVHVLSGVSSFPVVTAAAVMRLSLDFSRVDAITGGVAPSPYAGVGGNVIRAIATYAGKPVPIRRDGGSMTAFPLTETRRATIAPPGQVPLASRLFSLVEVPDLVLLPAIRPEVRSVWIGAGPVPALSHRLLIGLAWLVRLGALPSLEAFVPLFLAAADALRWGEHRGGLFVELEGLDRQGLPLVAGWHLVAEGDSGPLIPAMAAEGIVRRHLAGDSAAPGARPASGALDLDDLERLFARWRIATGIRRSSSATAALPLYPRLLGEAWDRLPAAVRGMHAPVQSAVAEGRGSVERGAHPLARLAARLFRFPPAGTDLPVSVRFARHGDEEVWHRRFGGHAFQSRHTAEAGRWLHLIVERFGPFAFGLALVVADCRLHFVVRRWTLFGIPLPLALAPTSEASESEVEGRFVFDVALAHRAFGLIVRYRGWLDPPRSGARASSIPTGSRS